MHIYRNKLLLASIIIVVLVAFFILERNMYTSSITGNAVTNTRVQLMPVRPTNCTLHLYPGWNLVSFFCLGLFVDRDTALQSIDGEYSYIFAYSPTDAVDPWKSYNPNLPNWTVQQLNFMDRISGYWIYVSNDTDYLYSGVNSSSNVPLYTGWNLVGYPGKIDRLVNDSLACISFNIVKTYITPSDTWLIYINGGSNNSLILLQQNKGYWINSSSSQTWVIS